MLDNIVQWVVSLMEALGAPGVGIAILLETIFPPIPSELVLPLAGFTSTQGNLSAVAAFIWATAGSLVGAWLLYWLGAAVGARRLRDIADKMPLTEATDVDKSILLFSKYGSAPVFIGRLIPGVRSLISIPAGVERMPLLRFSAWTLAGSAVLMFDATSPPNSGPRATEKPARPTRPIASLKRSAETPSRSLGS